MNLKTFQGSTMAEALQRVKREFGRDAVILSTRTIARSGALGLGGKSCVEITAAPDTTAIPRALQGASVSLRSASTGGQRTAPQKSGNFQSPTSSGTDHVLFSAVGELKGLVQSLVAQTQKTRVSQLPNNLHRIYHDLIERAFAEDLALQLVEQVQSLLGGANAGASENVREKLARLVVPMLPVAGPIQLRRKGSPTIVALVGPTGSGKTTTIAKLAAGAVLRDRTSVGLITIDTYRIGAVDQLKTYAQIMDIPLEVVCAPDELPDALARLGDRQLVLIDTAGRGQRDTAKIDDLRRFFAAAPPDEVHVVLSAGCSERILSEVVDRFKPVGVNRVLFTKLDEAVGLGIILAAAKRANASLSYVTTGQDVPSDIAVADAAALAKMMLGACRESDGTSDGPMAA